MALRAQHTHGRCDWRAEAPATAQSAEENIRSKCGRAFGLTARAPGTRFAPVWVPEWPRGAPGA
eukprot:3213640-Prymnesium_polylepis.1